MSKNITIKFTGFWPTFKWNDNRILHALEASRHVTVLPPDNPDVPDILIYSWMGRREALFYDCLKIYYTGENDFPDFNECDYALSFVESDCGGRNMRFPLFMLYDCIEGQPPRLDDDEALNRGFCSYVMSNVENCDPMRVILPDLLDSYKPLAYGGVFRNNTGGRVDDKDAFIAKYKFNLAVENSKWAGYVTEKIAEPLCLGSVPVYWGDSAVLQDFNPASYIYVGDYDSLDNLLAEVRRIDNDDEAYLKMLRAPKHLAELRHDYDTRLAEYLGRIADNMERKIPRYGRAWNNLLEQQSATSILRLPLASRIYNHMVNRLRKRGQR